MKKTLIWALLLAIVGICHAEDIVITIRGGTVYAWSEVGAPEEGLDSDFAPIAIQGGTLFTVGGGMGEMPSVPTQETAKQPTVLLIGPLQ